MNQSLGPAIALVMPTARNTGLFRSKASFSQPPTAQGPTGNFIGDYTPVVDLQGLACMDAPESFGPRIQANLQKTVDQILSGTYRHVLLDRFYAAVFPAAEEGWRVTIADTDLSLETVYEVLGVEADSQRTQTRLRLQKVEF